MPQGENEWLAVRFRFRSELNAKRAAAFFGTIGSRKVAYFSREDRLLVEVCSRVVNELQKSVSSAWLKEAPLMSIACKRGSNGRCPRRVNGGLAHVSIRSRDLATANATWAKRRDRLDRDGEVARSSVAQVEQSRLRSYRWKVLWTAENRSISRKSEKKRSRSERNVTP